MQEDSIYLWDTLVLSLFFPYVFNGRFSRRSRWLRR